MQWNLENYATDLRKATASAEVSLGWEFDGDFRQHGFSLNWNLSSDI